MNQLLSKDLAAQMAIERIVMDLTDLMVPAAKARERAHKIKEAHTQQWLRVENEMLSALLALQELGYFLTRNQMDT